MTDGDENGEIESQNGMVLANGRYIRIEKLDPLEMTSLASGVDLQGFSVLQRRTEDAEFFFGVQLSEQDPNRIFGLFLTRQDIKTMIERLKDVLS